MVERPHDRRGPLAAGIVLGALYVLTGLAHYIPEWSWLSAQIRGDEGALELTEAALWAIACILFGRTTLTAWRRGDSSRWWFAFLALMLLIASPGFSALTGKADLGITILTL